MKNKNLKQWLREKKQRILNRTNYHPNPTINRRINLIVLIVETLFIAYALNALYDCPCSYRTCTLTQLYPNGSVSWEAKNLDCQYVQRYLEKERSLGYPVYEENTPGPLGIPTHPLNYNETTNNDTNPYGNVRLPE